MKTILVIENNSNLRQALAQWLELEGFYPLTAEDGALGLTLARKHLPQIVLCDDRAPGLNGIELIRVLRNDDQTAHIPCFFLTTEVDVDYFFKALSSGANGFLKKPVDLIELRRLLQGMVNQAKSTSSI